MAGRSVKDIWDFWAGRYEGLWSQKFVLGPSRDLVMRHLAELNPAGLRILDAGCGVGQLAAEAADRFPDARITGIDASGAMIARAHRDYARRNIEYRVAPAGGLESGPEYDAVVCTHAFPYFPGQQGVLGGFYDCMRPGGTLLVLNSNLNNAYDWLWLKLVRLTTSRSRYPSVAVLKRMMERAGFVVRGHERIRTASFVPSVFLVAAVKPLCTEAPTAGTDKCCSRRRNRSSHR